VKFTVKLQNGTKVFSTPEEGVEYVVKDGIILIVGDYCKFKNFSDKFR
jgi:hypothetical protein